MHGHTAAAKCAQRPEAAIAALLQFQGPIILDLDETLYLRNSTEDFLDCARPGVVAFYLLYLLEVVAPWRFIGGYRTRDNWRIYLVLMIFPWTLWRWRWQVRRLGVRYRNVRLLAAVRECGCKPIIVSNGYCLIARPLVMALGLGDSPMVACRLNKLSDRRNGKVALARSAVGDEVVRSALVITDLIDDLSLLEACTSPHLAKWPEAFFRRAFSEIYVPGRYLSAVKRPGKNYISRVIVKDDLALWLLCSVFVSDKPLLLSAGLTFLLISFWLIYEFGYLDNDRMSFLFEARPAVSAQFHSKNLSFAFWKPWACSIVFAMVGLVCIRFPDHPTPVDAVKWVSVLGLMFGFFIIYNRCNKVTRVWLYPGLRFARYSAFAVLVPIPLVACAAIFGKVVASWIEYILHRTRYKSFSSTRLLFLVAFALQCIAMALSAGVQLLWNLTALGLLIFALVKARKDIGIIIRTATN